MFSYLRRRLLALGGLTIAGSQFPGLHALAVRASEFLKGPPIKDHPVRQLTPHVWVIEAPDGFPTPENQGMMANIVFVVGRAGVILVDTGASVQIGEMAIRQLRTVTDKPVVGIINTHYHGDHWLGNQAFVEAYGADLPRYAHPDTRTAIAGAEGTSWLSAMIRWTDQAVAGTQVVAPTHDVTNGYELSLGDVHLRLHHYGRAHTPSDISVEVTEDGVMCVGDVLMDRRIANMDDGSYVGTFETMDALVANSRTRIWLPGHGTPGPGVLAWQRELFEGIYEPCLAAVKEGMPLEQARTAVLSDPRVASRAAETKGWASNIGKYLSLAYLEAEQAAF